MENKVHLPAQDYFDAPGLSQSGMKDLAVSPLRYWYLHVNPERPAKRETAEMQFGSALHCAVLQPEHFSEHYARELIVPDGALVTMDDLRTHLKNMGVTPKGTRKADVITQVLVADGDALILDVLEAQHREANTGKAMLSVEDWSRVQSAAASLRREPKLQEILKEGESEVSFFVTDPDTGVPLKARMDWITPAVTLDLKTFTQQRGRSIDKSIGAAVMYEGYYIQAYFYAKVRALAAGDTRASATQKAPEHVLPFVESQEPFEVRLRSLLPRNFGEVNLLWEKARVEVKQLIALYAECWARFGEKPWRYAQEITPIEDGEIPGLNY